MTSHPRTKWSSLLLAFGLVLLAPSLSRADLKFTITGSSEFSGSGASFTGSIEVTFKDAGSNTVTMIIDATGASGSSGSPAVTGFISDFHFNVKNLLPTAVSASNATPSIADVDAFSNNPGANDYKADGGEKSNLLLTFKTGNSDNRFNLGEKVEITLTGVGLDETDFNALSSSDKSDKPDFHVAMHVQSIPTTKSNSGWFYDTTVTINAVPGPHTFALALAGALPLFGAYLRRRKIARS